MLRFRTFGTVDLREENAGRLRRLLQQAKPLAVLAYLAVHEPVGPVRREQLISLLWSDSAPTRARAALSTTLSRLRKELGGGVLMGRGREAIALSGEHFRSDVADFDRAVDEQRYSEAIDLYRGPFLEGFRPPTARPFEKWMDRIRDQCRQRAYAAAMRSAACAREAGSPAGAEEYLERALQIEPLREDAIRRLVVLLAERANVGRALQLYETFRTRHVEELGFGPSDELLDLIADLDPDSAD